MGGSRSGLKESNQRGRADLHLGDIFLSFNPSDWEPHYHRKQRWRCTRQADTRPYSGRRKTVCVLISDVPTLLDIGSQPEHSVSTRSHIFGY
jgi:hypothetical protein